MYVFTEQALAALFRIPSLKISSISLSSLGDISKSLFTINTGSGNTPCKCQFLDKLVIPSFVFFIILGFIFNIIFSVYLYSKCDNYKKHRISQLLFTIVNILYNSFVVYFMYKACQTCNGLWGFVYLLGIGIVFTIISTLLFNKSMERMKICIVDEAMKYGINTMEKAK